MTQLGYTPIHISPYRSGVCWFGIRAAEANGPQRFCGAGAGKYRVRRIETHLPEKKGTQGEIGVLGPLSSSVEVQEVWLCYKHVSVMERKGYCCHMIEG